MQTQTKSDQTEKSLIEHQIMLEQLLDKNQLHRRIRNEFITSGLPFIEAMEDNGIPHTFGFDLLAQMALAKRTTVSTLVGVMRKHLGCPQQTADMLKRCVQAELVTYDPQMRQFICNFNISQDVQEELDRFQFPLPMVVQPHEVRRNKDSGYILSNASLVLKDNYTDDDICLDHINRTNAIAFSINHAVVTKVKNSWKSLDRQKAGETADDFKRRKKAFEKFDRTAKDVINLVTQLTERIYLTHRYDKRGRTYCMGYHVNYQGNPWSKAIVELADKELVE
jgi:hypothetical protein